MSEYPSYDQLRNGSQPRHFLPATHFTAVNGQALGVVTGNTRRRRFPVRHLISDSEYQTIMALYKNKQRRGNQPFSLTFTSDFDSVEYDVYFAAPPRREKAANDLYHVFVELVEAD